MGVTKCRLPVEMELVWNTDDKRSKQNIKKNRGRFVRAPHGANNTSPSESPMDLDELRIQRLQTTRFILVSKFRVITTTNRTAKKMLPQASRYRSITKVITHSSHSPGGQKAAPPRLVFARRSFPHHQWITSRELCPTSVLLLRMLFGSSHKRRALAQIHYLPTYLPRNSIP